MATKTRQQIVTEITGNVSEIGASSRAETNSGVVVQLDGGKTMERHDIPVWIIQESGALTPATQAIQVKYDGETEVEAFLSGRIMKDWVDPPNREQDLLDKFNALETAMGGPVKVNPTSLDTLGLKYLVFLAADGIERVQVTLNGTVVVRETC